MDLLMLDDLPLLAFTKLQTKAMLTVRADWLFRSVGTIHSYLKMQRMIAVVELLRSPNLIETNNMWLRIQWRPKRLKLLAISHSANFKSLYEICANEFQK